jgi:hypothetical protein
LSRVGLAVLLWLLPTVARAQPEPPPHYERGRRYFDLKMYKLAIAEFEAAYALDPRPELLYALAQAHRLDGDCQHALPRYRAFLQTELSPKKAAAVQQNIERCEALVRGPTAPERASPVEPPAVEPRAPAPLAPPAPAVERRAVAVAAGTAPRRPWYADWLGDTLAAGGLGVAAVGLGVWGAARADALRLSGALTYGDFRSAAPSAQRSFAAQEAGVVVAAVGGALVVGGVVRLALQARRR